MSITEKDIFDFVFFKETLESNKMGEIMNSSDAKTKVEFYRELKQLLLNDLSADTKNKLAEKIPLYLKEDTITLRPVNIPERREKINLSRYAAASGEDKATNTTTFLSDDRNYLIRLHKVEGNYKIFVFSTLRKKLSNMELVFHPSEDKLSLKDNMDSFFITLSQMPDSIDMKLI